MSRYLNEITTTKSPEQIASIAPQYLTKEGFTLRTYTDGRDGAGTPLGQLIL